ncbi:MAG: hypothetical protein LBK47_03500 [Prevotellaceae bacterium]|jgi:hypothetical protein|nr:hypothetical protein [Prevotellaceae bacterium]
MINTVIRFILSAVEADVRLLYLPASLLQEKISRQNLCGKQRTITAPQYRKRFTIWELGKNKFTRLSACHSSFRLAGAVTHEYFYPFTESCAGAVARKN